MISKGVEDVSGSGVIMCSACGKCDWGVYCSVRRPTLETNSRGYTRQLTEDVGVGQWEGSAESGEVVGN